MKKLIEAPDVAELLYGDRARAPRVHELARQGLLPAVRLGRQVRFDPDAIDEFITSGGKALDGGWRREPRGSAD